MSNYEFQGYRAVEIIAAANQTIIVQTSTDIISPDLEIQILSIVASSPDDATVSMTWTPKVPGFVFNDPSFGGKNRRRYGKFLEAYTPTSLSGYIGAGRGLYVQSSVVDGPPPGNVTLYLEVEFNVHVSPTIEDPQALYETVTWSTTPTSAGGSGLSRR